MLSRKPLFVLVAVCCWSAGFALGEERTTVWFPLDSAKIGPVVSCDGEFQVDGGNPGLAWKQAAFSQYPRGKAMGDAMRTDRYRFTRWQDRKEPDKVHGVELHDHQNDPEENVNLANRPEHANLVGELTAQLKAGWRAAKPQ